MHKLAQICIQRPVFATMLILGLTVIGAFSFFGLGVDLLPKIDLPTVIVTVNNPGASPEQIETEITKRVEDAVNTISGIDELRSTTKEGFSQVIVPASIRARSSSPSTIPESRRELRSVKLKRRCCSEFNGPGISSSSNCATSLDDAIGAFNS